MKIPCEIIVWDILPVIRKEIAKSLIKDHGLTQRKAAKKLGLTEAAVSRYVSGKRGEVKNLNKEIMIEIQVSTSRICNGDSLILIEEICRICDLFKSKGLINNTNDICK